MAICSFCFPMAASDRSGDSLMRFSMHLAAFLDPVFKRWATYLDMCLQPVGNTTGSQVILWNCRRRSLVFESSILPPSGSEALHFTRTARPVPEAGFWQLTRGAAQWGAAHRSHTDARPALCGSRPVCVQRFAIQGSLLPTTYHGSWATMWTKPAREADPTVLTRTTIGVQRMGILIMPVTWAPMT